MAELVKSKITAGKLPMDLAVTVLYVSGMRNGEGIGQSTIADAAGVTDVTIRNRLKELRRNKLEIKM
jgi:transcription initiation factor TFIIB